jgi:hypothetical protein
MTLDILRMDVTKELLRKMEKEERALFRTRNSAAARERQHRVLDARVVPTIVSMRKFGKPERIVVLDGGLRTCAAHGRSYDSNGETTGSKPRNVVQGYLATDFVSLGNIRHRR